MDKQRIITIDGPAGSGKSTTAILVAERLGFTFLDTGAMYRALTLKALRKGLDVASESEILSLTNATHIELSHKSGRLKVLLDGEDVTEEIRNSNVSNHVAKVAAHGGARKWLMQMQRRIGARGNIVAEGRDVGSVVFPDARLKIFLIASIEERAKRRFKELRDKNEKVNVDQLIDEIEKRDELDRSRAASPLMKAENAIELDTTNLTIAQQVDFIVNKWNNENID